MMSKSPPHSSVSPKPQPAKPLGTAGRQDAQAAKATAPPPPLTPQELARIPAGASSAEALSKATGGKVEQIGQIRLSNALILNLDGRRFVYARPQRLNQGRNTGYGTAHLRKKLDPSGSYAGRQFDHVASTGVEGGRLGMGYVLMAFAKQEVNQSHGGKVEKGPVPVREAAKAFQGGIDRDGKHHVTYMTQEMVDKLAGKGPAGRGHGVYRHQTPSPDRKEVTHALMADATGQSKLASLARTPKKSGSTVRNQQATRSAPRGRGR